MASAPAWADAENAAGRLWAANQWKASSAVTPLGETDSAGIGLERAGQRGVQRPALAGQQVVGQRLAHERVAEAVGAGLGLDDDDVVRHRLAQSGHELVGRDAGRALEQPVAHARAGDGREAQDGLGGRAERLDAQHQRVGDVGRQALAGRRRRPAPR